MAAEALWLIDGGGMGELIRTRDWSKTPLGPIESWPQSLRITVNLCLASTHPMMIAWGPERVMVYNDAYRDLSGDKHPALLGQDFREGWASAWPTVGDHIETAYAGKPVLLEDLRVFLDRKGFLEETFFTCAFSPIRDETGSVAGVLNPGTENTAKVLGIRRARVLRDVAECMARARTLEEVFTLAAQTLEAADHDLPFTLFYLRDPGDGALRRVGSTGLEPGSAASPPVLGPEARTGASWPFSEVMRTREPVRVSDLAARFGPLACGPYPESPSRAVLLPFLPPGQDEPVALLVAGVSARLELDEAYADFHARLAAAVATAIAQVQAQEQARAREQALAALDRAKTTFFSHVSHEFRAPLTLMLAPIEECLTDTRQPLLPRQRERMELARRSGFRLMKLVNSLLEFSRVEAGQVPAHLQATDLALLTADLASTFRASTDRARLTLTVDMPGQPVPVHVDREMWEKIVLNLVSNAFKFTHEGGITVRLRPLPDHVELSVQDTGVGISAEQLPLIFDRFYRAPDTRGRTLEGTGIGLSLVQELVKLLGGTLRVESVPGQGSCFTVCLPARPARLSGERLQDSRAPVEIAQQAAPFLQEAELWLRSLSVSGSISPGVPVTPEPSRGSSRVLPGHILLADDNADMRHYLHRLLTEQGWSVHAVEDGAQALAAIRAQPPDVVISDVMMPRLDGLSLLRELRADPVTRATSIILLSSRAGEESRIEGLGVGADDYLVKPFSARELVARVQSQLAQTRLRRTAEGYREQLHQLFKRSPAAIAILTGPGHVFEFVNSRYEALTRHQSTLLGRPFRQAFPELEGQGFFELMDEVYRTGEPFTGQEMAAMLDRRGDGQLEQGFFNFSFLPYKSPDGQVQGVVAFVFDATDWVRSRQQAEQRAAELEAVIQSIPDGVCIADATGIIRSTRIERELLRSTGIEEACARALQGEASIREVRVPLGPSGEERIIRSATEPVRLRDQIVGAVSLNMDITERKRAEAEREVLLASEQAARMEAERANRRKDEFLARISHELATPLVGMRLWLDLLQTDERKRPEALVALRQCTQTQSKLVHDLLDTARALNGKLTVSLEANEPSEPVQAAVSAIRPLADQKGVALKVSLRQTPLVLADPERLQQVVSNLLANAVKFTPAGGKVEVRLEPQRDGVGIVVQDTGRGFPADFQALLFTPFRQEEEGTTRSSGGLGLGLAIVRQLVELHGGKVRAESPGRGQGATFTVWLPALAEDAEDVSRVESPSALGRQLEGVRLLLVEDDVLTRMAVLSVFEQQGAEVQAVGSAAAALELVRTSRFDAMLCDIAMPGEDGYSLIRKVRALEPPANQLPAAAFTAHMREGDRTHALVAGFHMHIPKAVEPAQLIAQVRLLALGRSGEG